MYFINPPLGNVFVFWTVPFPYDVFPIKVAFICSLSAAAKTSDADALFSLIRTVILYVFSGFFVEYFISLLFFVSI